MADELCAIGKVGAGNALLQIGADRLRLILGHALLHGADVAGAGDAADDTYIGVSPVGSGPVSAAERSRAGQSFGLSGELAL